jgi:hypothetical protein
MKKENMGMLYKQLNIGTTKNCVNIESEIKELGLTSDQTIDRSQLVLQM